MNTRLQVEHPVTEAVFGLDLVALQLRIAEGEALAPAPPEPTGHAVEARLYAEDPAQDWRPQTGVLHTLALPGEVRVDTGFTDGDTVGIHYDPMLAKVVAHAPTRAEAVRTLAHALAGARIHGLTTNRELLVRSLRHPEFTAGQLDTGFFERHLMRPHRGRPGRHPGRPRRGPRRSGPRTGRPPRRPPRRLAQRPLPAADPPLHRRRRPSTRSATGPDGSSTTRASGCWPPPPPSSPSKSRESGGCST